MEDGARRRFTIGPCLGRGGFGEVYRAVQESAGGLQSTVAVKVLRADLDAEADAVRRLRDEGRLLARLNHPTILKVYDLVVLEGRVALVAEYVDGADLSELMAPGEGLSLRALLQVVGKVAAALHAAWSTPGADGQPLRLVHRDIKPTNIRIGRHGEVKLLDFGIAHFQGEGREAQTATDVIVGSLPYMAPERFLVREAQPASDVFALGCTLYEGLVGERFYGSAHLRRVSGLALDDELFEEFAVERLGALPPGTHDQATELLVELLAYEPERRPTAEAVAERCLRIADELSGATLRRHCRARTWAPAEVEDGPLVGRVVAEGTVALGPQAPQKEGRPTVQRAPQQTLDGSHLPGRPEVAGASEAPAAGPAPSRIRDKPPRTRLIAVAGCGAAGLAIVLLVSGLAGVAVLWMALSSA